MTTLRNGSRGYEVRELQELLQACDYNVVADGIFGDGTEAAVKDYQWTNGLVADGIVGEKTWEKLKETPADGDITPDAPWIVEQYEKHGYELYTDGRVNFGSIRRLDGTPNRFDDWVFCLTKPNGGWVLYTFKATTDPGTYWLENPSRTEGTAILVPGQYVKTHKIDLHGGKYEALCQRLGPVSVWRDNDKDEVADYQVGEEGIEGWYGINIHRASSSRESAQVDKWSAGCQVIADPGDFSGFMSIVHQEADKYGNAFTWTLLERKA